MNLDGLSLPLNLKNNFWKIIENKFIDAFNKNKMNKEDVVFITLPLSENIEEPLNELLSSLGIKMISPFEKTTHIEMKKVPLDKRNEFSPIRLKDNNLEKLKTLLNNKHVVLFDDIITTGTTMKNAINIISCLETNNVKSMSITSLFCLSSILEYNLKYLNGINNKDKDKDKDNNKDYKFIDSISLNIDQKLKNKVEKLNPKL